MPGTASLAVQRLKLHLAMQGTQVLSWSGKIPHAAEQLSPCATTTELTLQSPRVATTEPVRHSDWSLCSAP